MRILVHFDTYGQKEHDFFGERPRDSWDVVGVEASELV